MQKFVLLNGPPRVGKNTAAKILKENLPSCAVVGFSHYLKRFVHSIYLGRRGWDLDPDAFDAVKSIPQDCLGGMTWRQAYIYYSENVIKVLHGKEWFGRKFLELAQSHVQKVIAVSDSGFREESEAVIRHAGPTNVLLVRLHADGHTFEGDSRSYIDLTDLGVRVIDIENNSTIEYLQKRLLLWANHFIAGTLDDAIFGIRIVDQEIFGAAE